jgi:hypothetical protein
MAKNVADLEFLEIEPGHDPLLATVVIVVAQCIGKPDKA